MKKISFFLCISALFPCFLFSGNRPFQTESPGAGLRYFQLPIPAGEKYNTFILFQKSHPDKLKLYGCFQIPKNSGVHSFAELYLKTSKQNDLQIFLRLNKNEVGWKIFQVLQGCTGIKYRENNLQWGKFFLKTTTAADGKFQKNWDELSGNETGFFIYPLSSSTALSPIALEKIKSLLTRQEK